MEALAAADRRKGARVYEPRYDPGVVVEGFPEYRMPSRLRENPQHDNRIEKSRRNALNQQILLLNAEERG